MGLFGWLRRGSRRGVAVAEAEPEQPAAEVIHGRLRTAGVPYALPRDLQEINRLDYQHYLFRYALRGNVVAPVGQPRAILDVGCGTGIWAREVATQFPEANVIGIDVMQPPADDAANRQAALDLRPPNYAFVPGNILEGLPFADASFDFVHMRLLFVAIPADRWQSVVNELVRVTRPGGWVELVESGPALQPSPAMDVVATWGVQAVARRGININYGSKVGEFARGAGLVNLESRMVPVPLGAWGERLGRMAAADYLGGVQGVAGFMVAAGLATQVEVDRAFAAARADVESPHLRASLPIYVAYGQRPLA